MVVAAPRKCDPETRERAVRMYQDRIAEYGDSKLATRKHVGQLLAIHQRRCAIGLGAATAPFGSAVSTSGRRQACRAGCTSQREHRIAKSERDFEDRNGAFAAAEVDRRLRWSSTTSTRTATGSGSTRSALCPPSTVRRSPRPPTTAPKARGPVSEAVWAEAHAAHAVQRLYVANRRLYGVRKMWHAMKHPGHDIGRDQVPV